MKYVKIIHKLILLYLFLVLSSGMTYSYTITRVVSTSNLSPFLVIVINSIISILVFIFIKKISILHFRIISLITSFSLLILFFLSYFLQSEIIILLVTYVVLFFSSSYVGRSLEEKIFESEERLFGGMAKISIAGNLAKLIGFGLGAFIFNIPSTIYIFLSLVLFIVIASINVESNFSYDKVVTISPRKVESVFLLIFMSFISSIPMLWIPSLVERFDQEGMIRLSFIPFILPGIMNVLFLRYLKDKEYSRYIPLSYFVISLLFMVIYFTDTPLIFQVIMLSTTITLGVSINVYINTIFIHKNKTRDKRELMQIIQVSISISNLLFSFLGMYIHSIVHFMLLINAILSLVFFISFERMKVNEKGYSSPKR
ncbi:putative membrane protein [Anoxybacillus flavithermus TNO-09.006]|uniref:MFS transporter n=1 Tax=Anoxybacillus flavithermus TaxID=33934 RepID=A0A178TD43_9BACL|nr:putative membrane protein [Anoxybacillus flavithermus TNO-09.006]OAO79345.1 hypothetical protein TAF16_1664 [Anoxybacillus flavithermus]